MKKLWQVQAARIFTLLALACALMAFAVPGQAQTFNTLHTFAGQNSLDGAYGMGLVQGTNGILYGTTLEGGDGADGGTFFEISPTGKNYKLLFTVGSGATDPYGDVVFQTPLLATNGSFYLGTGGTNYGCSVGNGACGVIVETTATGTATAKHDFCTDYSDQGVCLDGDNPNALTQASTGLIYGTTTFGGAYNYGTIFSLSTGGTFTLLYSFCANGQGGICPDGSPDFSPLVEGPDGNLYGTTSSGGANNYGAFYRITPAGKFTTLYSFCSQTGCADGGWPGAEATNQPGYGFALGNDGNFYGTTVTGGANDYGTFYKMTPSGALTVLYNFCTVNTPVSCADGDEGDQVILGSDGNFYGLTRGGGANGDGIIYQMTSAGVQTVLHNFDYTDGTGSGARLMQATNGAFYGTTFYSNDSSCDCGTVFELNTSLKPLVQTLPASGKVGATIDILGSSLKGATAVTFNGTAATFTVSSNTLIKAKIPTGATSGYVKVTTPTATLTSGAIFTIP